MISKQIFERSSDELYFVIEENYDHIKKKLLDKSKRKLNTWSGESENVKEKPIAEFFRAINLDDSLEELNKKLMKEKEQVLIEYGKDHFERELYSYLYIDPLCPAPYNDSDNEDKKIPAQRIFAYPVQTAVTFAENNDERFESWFDEQKKRNRFISKVFAILFIQLLFTASFIFLAITNGAVKEFIQEQFALIAASLAIETTVYFTLVCVESSRRKTPINYILLALFTAASTYISAYFSVYFDTDTVFLAFGSIAVIVAIIVFIAFINCIDVTACGFYFYVIILSAAIFSAFVIVHMIITQTFTLYYILLYILLIVTVLFLLYHVEMVMGKGRYALSPKEYVFATLTLYTCIIDIFRILLQILSYRS